MCADESKDLISFDCDSENSSSQRSEIERLFDPLFNASSKNIFKDAGETNFEADSITVSLPSEFDIFSHPTSSPLKYDTIKSTDKTLITPNLLEPYLKSSNEFAFYSLPSVSTEKADSECYPIISEIDGLNNTGSNNDSCMDNSSPTVFLTNVQANLELEQFVNSVQCIKRLKYLYSTKIHSSSSFEQSMNGTTDELTHYLTDDYWIYNNVFGNLSTNCYNNDFSSINSNQSCNNYLFDDLTWFDQTGARNVAHLKFISTHNTPPNISVSKSNNISLNNPGDQIPSVHLPKWIIPQLEICIIPYLKFYNKELDNSNETGVRNTDYSTSNTNTKLLTKLRLACDPTTTLVSELMMEALASDLIPHGSNLNVRAYQLRLHGKAELLRPEARLCDCHEVQLCHRLDQPLNLVLEPRIIEINSDHKGHDEVQESFKPQISDANSSRQTPSEEDAFISYSIFQNALEKIRSSIVENNGKVSPTVWFNGVYCATTSLAQSIKAIMITICEGVTFPDVINSLGNVQVCIMEILSEIGLDNRFLKIKNTNNNQTNNFMLLFGSVRKRFNASESMTVLDSKSFNNNTIISITEDLDLKAKITTASRTKLNQLLINLEQKLIGQLNAIFDWKQTSICVNNQLANKLALIESKLRQVIWTKSNKLNGRPLGMIFDEENSNINSAQNNIVKREIRCSSECVEPFVVGLIAIHRPPRKLTDQNTSNSNTSNSNNLNNMNSQFNMDHYYCVHIGLTYAGRPLNSVCPHEFNPESLKLHWSNSKNQQIHQSQSHHLSQTSQKIKRDSFISDPCHYQTIQPDYPKILQFDQWFPFSGFTINQLPRETLLSISLFSCKKYTSEVSEAEGTLIGWANMPIFDARGRLKQNTVILGLWPPNEPMHDYRSTYAQSNTDSQCSVVQICLPEFDFDIEFPRIEINEEMATDRHKYDHSVLCSDAKQSINKAKHAILLQTLHPELSHDSILECLTSYSNAASSIHRFKKFKETSSPEHFTLPILQLSAINSTNILQSMNGLNTSILPNGITSNISSGINFTNGSTNNTNTSCNSGLSSIYALNTVLSSPPAMAVEVLWNLRHFLYNLPDSLIAFVIGCLVTWPQAIRKINQRNTVWNWECLLKEIYSILLNAQMPYPARVIRLLAHDVVDQGIRHWAVKVLSSLPSDVLLMYIPQLLEVINHDLYLDYSGLVSLLLYRAAFSMRFANAIYWHLRLIFSQSKSSISNWRMKRFEYLQSGLFYLASDRIRQVWKRQEDVIERLSVAAMAVKQAKPCSAVREELLHGHLKDLMTWLNEKNQQIDKTIICPKKSQSNPELLVDLGEDINKVETSDKIDYLDVSLIKSSLCDTGVRMPYNPGLLTHSIDIPSCTYFTSFTCPLRLVFHALDTGVQPFMAMFKIGDDLRLDNMICQLTLLMDRIWLDAGLDLRMIHFRITPTEEFKGLIELVCECSTLRQIQQQGGGITGPFKECVITKWLQSQNTTELDYKRALDNFLRSLAGCCVATYVLGVGDRHNDNIMIRYSGHVFHVDFAKVFGNSQTFAGFKRDRVPFVLTQDMMHVLQTYSKDVGGIHSNLSGFGSHSSGKGSDQQGVQLFIDYCCEAYNLLRRRMYELVSLLELSVTMGIPGINRDCVRYILRALTPELSEQQASQHFTILIRKTLQSRSTTLNFFVHGLAQAKQAAIGGGVLGTTGSINTNQLSPSNTNSSFRIYSLNNNNTDINRTGKEAIQMLSEFNAATNNIYGPLFTFNPKRFTVDTDGHIDAIVVDLAVRIKSEQWHSDYYFPLNVWRTNCRVPTRVFRRIADIEELNNRLQESFPDSRIANTSAHIINALNSTNVTSSRARNQVQALIDDLLEEVEVVSKSDVVYTFFHSILLDERFSAEDNAQLDFNVSSTGSEINTINWSRNTSSPQYSKSLLNARSIDTYPALQIQLLLNENLQRLDILIKHGRWLYIPGTTEPPDVYIKLYLLNGGHRKSVKQKTNVIRRCSSPSFNASFSYDLDPRYLKYNALDVSAWHFVHIGENILIGQIFIHLNTIRPGTTLTHWYKLCASNQLSVTQFV